MTNAKMITFEGVEGVGKSTNIAFVRQYLNDSNIECCVTREPGGTPLAEAVRGVLLADYEEVVLSDTEALLLSAGRVQHIEHVIKPALAQGQWVLCDRFSDATIAYQSGGRQVDLDRIKALNTWVLNGLEPDLTILFDAPVEIGLERIKQRKALDRIEKEQVEFFERVRASYLALAKEHSHRYRIVDASGTLESVQEALAAVFNEFIHD